MIDYYGAFSPSTSNFLGQIQSTIIDTNHPHEGAPMRPYYNFFIFEAKRLIFAPLWKHLFYSHEA